MTHVQQSRPTPGVYITEVDAFGTSIVGVSTAVPVFAGYTEFAGHPTTGEPLYGTPIAINSMNEYLTYFGGAAPARFAVSLAPPADTPSFQAWYTPDGAAPTLQNFLLAPEGVPEFTLFWQMQLFFANGGGNCYVVSAGSYWSGELPISQPDPDGWLPGAIAAADLTKALETAGYQVGPTMIVIPEACQLDQADYANVACAMLAQAGTLQDRVAILDLPGCLAASDLAGLEACQSSLWNAIALQIGYASYGAAYGPALITSVIGPADLHYTSLQSADNSLINNILTTQAVQTYAGTQLSTLQSAIAAAFPVTGVGSAYPPPAPGQTLAQWQTALDNLLQNALPIYAQIKTLCVNAMNVMAPSGAMAGVWTKTDNMSGVWNAPANVALASVVAPLYNMNDAEQAGFNQPVNGQAIDIIRNQINRGTVVWGARTLDGNSLDYRYIQVRRTLIYIEQSIKAALNTYVFAANDAMTWTTVSSAISSFLTGLWQQGGLAGAKASDAFTVAVGLGSTMTSQDVLNGNMIVAVSVSIVHPAEFIELTFVQSMQS